MSVATTISNIKNSLSPQDKGDHESPLPYFDILGGPKRVGNEFLELATRRSTLGIQEVARYAGRGVLDQVTFARQEVTCSPLRSPLSFVASIPSRLLPIALGSTVLGIGSLVDFAIFHGAAEALIAADPHLAALSLGAPIFALSAGMSDEHRRKLNALMIAASLGAAVIVGNNDKLSSNFAAYMPSLKGELNTAKQNYEAAKGKYDGLKEQIQDIDDVTTGRDNPKNMFRDGDPHNDATATELVMKRNNELLPQLAPAKVAMDQAEQEISRTTQDNTAQKISRVISAFYMALWLAAAQYGIEAVVRGALKGTKNHLRKTKSQSTFRDFINKVESGDTVVAHNMVESAVAGMLTQLSALAAEGAGDDAEKQARFAALFNDDNFPKLLEIGVKHVFDTIVSRKSRWQRGRELVTGLRSKKADKPASSTVPMAGAPATPLPEHTLTVQSYVDDYMAASYSTHI